jgi:hypothetical protein
VTRERFPLASSGARARNENRRARPGASWSAVRHEPMARALDDASDTVRSARPDVPTAPTAALPARRACACGPGEPAAADCLCSRDPTFRGVLGMIETGEQRRQRFARTLDTAGRILRVVGDDDITLADVVPLTTSDIGSVIHRWTLNLAVLCRSSAADVWWEGYPVRWIRTVEQAPWLALAARRGGLRLTDDGIELEVVDAFLATRGRPMEILVGPVDSGHSGARSAADRTEGHDA